MRLPSYRRLGLCLGLGVLAWQAVNLVTGRFWHEYLVADLLASEVLILGATRGGERMMLVGFSMFLGIFVSATTGKLIVGGAHAGTIAAALAIVPCVMAVLGLANSGGRPFDKGDRPPGSE